MRKVTFILCGLIIFNFPLSSINADSTLPDYTIEEPMVFISKEVFKDLFYLLKIPSEYVPIAKETGEKLNIPYQIIYNLVKIESNWEHTAINDRYSNGNFDIGLTQINSTNFEYFYWKILNKPLERNINYKEFYSNPKNNLWTGFLYLNWLRNYYDGDLEKALTAYNCGLGKVNRNKVPKSTEEYVKFILTN